MRGTCFPTAVVLLLALSLSLPASTAQESAVLEEIPVDAGLQGLPEGWSVGSPSLQSRLDAIVKSHSLWESLRIRGQLAIGLVDLSDINHVRSAWINPHQMLYAASLPKIAVLLSAYQSMEDGLVVQDSAIESDIDAMIRYSDNAATTRVIDRLGLERIEAVLRSPRYGLYDERQGGGLWVGRRYAKESRRNPDPLHGLSHGATVHQVCRLYWMILTGQAVSPSRSRELLAHLQSPGLHHKFVHSLQDRYPYERMFRKSGSWENWHSDSILLWGAKGQPRFILVGLTETRFGEQLIQELASEVEPIVGRTR